MPRKITIELPDGAEDAVLDAEATMRVFGEDMYMKKYPEGSALHQSGKNMVEHSKVLKALNEEIKRALLEQ